MAIERLHQYRSRDISPLIDGETSRARSHNVIKTLSGRVMGELYADTPPDRARFRAFAAQHPRRRYEFIGFGETYIDKDGVERRHGFEPDIEHVTTGGTVITAENASFYLEKEKSRLNGNRA